MSSTTPFISYSPQFADVTGEAPTLTKVIETPAHEGPVYIPSQSALYFLTPPYTPPGTTDLRVSIRTLHFKPDGQLNAAAIFRDSSNLANGMTLGNDGNLIICEQGTKTVPGRVTKLAISPSSTPVVLVSSWRSLPFNSPNDVVMASDGTIWFTDPSYGALQDIKNAPQVSDYVYKFDPATSQTTVVQDSFNKPNGLAFSPDEKTLYVTDSGAVQEPGSYYVNLPHHIRAFDVVDGGLRNGRLFAVVSPGIPDGIKVDSDGRVYSSSGSGVQVFSKAGELIGEIVADGAVNFTFGGAGNNVLYILADTVVWAATLKATGIVKGGAKC